MYELIVGFIGEKLREKMLLENNLDKSALEIPQIRQNITPANLNAIRQFNKITIRGLTENSLMETCRYNSW